MNEHDAFRVELRQELQAATRAADREVAHLARRRRRNAGRSELVVRPEGAVEEQEIGSTGLVPYGVVHRPGGRAGGKRAACLLVVEPQTDVERLRRRRAGVARGAPGDRRGRATDAERGAGAVRELDGTALLEGPRLHPGDRKSVV